MNDLMIPEAGSVPAHILNPELARQANEDAGCGISTGAPPRIKLAGKQFQLVDGNGEAKAYPPASMVAGPDGNTYMPVIVLRAKRELPKTWYVNAYNPHEDASAPDCFSEDGSRPHPSIKEPQSETCETCQNNAFGSGKDQNGNPTAGKACPDTKILAVFVPNRGVHMLKIPAASLKNFGLYVKQLSNSGIPLIHVKTFVGFDMDCEFPKMVFKFGGYLEQQVIAKVAQLSQSAEVSDIIGGAVPTQALPVQPSAVEAAAKRVVEAAAAKKKADDEAAAKEAAAKEAAAKEAAAKEAAAKKKAAAAKKKADEEAAAAKKVATDDLGLGDDFGLGLGESVDSVGSDDGMPSDADLMAELGL